MTLEEYFGDWAEVLDIKEADRLVNKLVSSRLTVCPLPKNIFKAFRLCSLKDLKVVIIGQDPYPTVSNGQPIATGLAFGNDKNTPEDAYSPSLKVLKNSVIDAVIPSELSIFDCTLEEWEKQGVLLINSALSCTQGLPGSHSLLWLPFIKSFLSNLSRKKKGIIYVLMGANAKGMSYVIDKDGNHLIYTNHPSYYARTGIPMPSNLWDDINEILVKQYGYEKIHWYRDSI